MQSCLQPWGMWGDLWLKSLDWAPLLGATVMPSLTNAKGEGLHVLQNTQMFIMEKVGFILVGKGALWLLETAISTRHANEMATNSCLKIKGRFEDTGMSGKHLHYLERLYGTLSLQSHSYAMCQ